MSEPLSYRRAGLNWKHASCNLCLHFTSGEIKFARVKFLAYVDSTSICDDFERAGFNRGLYVEKENKEKNSECRKGRSDDRPSVL